MLQLQCYSESPNVAPNHPYISTPLSTSAPLPPHQTFFFFLNDPAPPEISPLPLHDALPIGAGGRIDRHIVLDLRLARAEEGGPVLDAAGGRLGITTFGPRAKVLVIPAATIERIVPALLKDGHIARGWLGIALQPVAVPDALHSQAGQSSGVMVMSIVDGGPAAKAGIGAGGLVLTGNGTPTPRLPRIAPHFAFDSIGRKAELRGIRGGAVLSLPATG